MTSMPGEPELVEFFGAEPRRLDPGIPDAYNTLSFHGDAWGVSFDPSSESVRIEYESQPVRLYVRLESVTSVTVERSAQGRSLLVIRERKGPGISRWTLDVGPHFAMSLDAE